VPSDKLNNARPDPAALPSGLIAVTGDEGCGKTCYLQGLAKALANTMTGAKSAPSVCYLDLSLPGLDAQTPRAFWLQCQAQWPDWNSDLQQGLMEVLRMAEHVDKQLFMLSRGSRRKVGLIASLASGAGIVCLDQPYVALDQASIQVLREFLGDVADLPARSWVVADYEADPALPWRQHIAL
jgi:ABC-type multidrug transport system ATPase subunit